MIRLLPDEQKSLAQYVYSLCAITLDESKGYLIESRLASLVEDSGCASYAALLQLAKADISRALERKIIDAITTNETSFFRDSSPFDLLRHKLVPELVDRRARTGAARIGSGARPVPPARNSTASRSCLKSCWGIRTVTASGCLARIYPMMRWRGPAAACLARWRSRAA